MKASHSIFSRISKRYYLSLLLSPLFLLHLSPAKAQVGVAKSWGYNFTGELGDGTNRGKMVPITVHRISNIARFAGSLDHSLFLRADGTVWAAGSNKFGQLGDGTGGTLTDAQDKNIPVKVIGLKNVVQVAAGETHSVALMADGTVWTWGDNSQGQLGDGKGAEGVHTHDTKTPIKVPTLSHIVQIASGNSTTLALRNDGKVFGWGYNGNGQVGDGTGIGKSSPTPLIMLSNMIQVSVGRAHSMGLAADGTLWAWGTNNLGQFGNGTLTGSSIPIHITKLSQVVQISAGGTHTLALKADGTVWAFGNNENGQLGDGKGADGTHNHDQTLPEQITSLSNVVALSAGYAHSLALHSDGTLSAWGLNEEGQLGDNTQTTRSAPVAVSGLSGQTYLVAGGLHSLSVQAPLLATKLSSLNGKDPSDQKIHVPYGKPIVLSALLQQAPGNPLFKKAIDFDFDGSSIGTATTGLAGKAAVTFSRVLSLERFKDYPIALSFAGDALYLTSQATATLVIDKANTQIIVRNATGKPGNTVALIGLLRRLTDNAPVPNVSLSFKVDGFHVGDATTDAKGTAKFALKLDDSRPVGAHTILVELFNDPLHNGSSGVGTLTIAQAPTRTTAFSLTGRRGKTVTLKAKLVRTTDTTGLSKRTIHFQIDSTEVGTATTDATGLATLAFTIPADTTVGVHTLGAQFDGDTLYLTSTDTSRTLTVK